MNEAMATLFGAGATLCTGIGAVIGALLVGFRQTAIAEKQNEVLRAQTDLAAASLRANLFERRVSVYQAAAECLRGINGEHDVEAAERRQKAFLLKMDESRFLFRPEVYQQLESLRDLASRHLYILRAIRHNVPYPTPECGYWGSDLELRMGEAWNMYPSLADVFVPDLRIDSPAPDFAEVKR